MAELIENTLVRHPETGTAVLLAAGGELPEWATGLVGGHLIKGERSAPGNPTANPIEQPKPAGDGPPPKGGAGSGAPEWRAYAARKGVEVPDDASRDDVIAALSAANVPTE
jgi:hypothetical protein